MKKSVMNVFIFIGLILVVASCSGEMPTNVMGKQQAGGGGGSGGVGGKAAAPVAKDIFQVKEVTNPAKILVGKWLFVGVYCEGNVRSIANEDPAVKNMVHKLEYREDTVLETLYRMENGKIAQTSRSEADYSIQGNLITEKTYKISGDRIGLGNVGDVEEREFKIEISGVNAYRLEFILPEPKLVNLCEDDSGNFRLRFERLKL